MYCIKANPTVKKKTIGYDAIITSKILDGLESAAMNETAKHTLAIFQFEGLRKILNTTLLSQTEAKTMNISLYKHSKTLQVTH